MKNYFLIFISILFLAGCSVEYKPSGFVPDPEAGIEDVFPDTIAGMQANVRLDFANDTCASISAVYGENEDVVIQILYITTYILNENECLEMFIEPYFKDIKTKKSVNGFTLYGRDDNFKYFAWTENSFVFYIKCKNDILDTAVYETFYLTLK